MAPVEAQKSRRDRPALFIVASFPEHDHSRLCD